MLKLLNALIAPPTTAGLVIRGREVELVVMKGRRVEHAGRVPFEGPEDHHVVQAIQQALAAAPVAIERLAVSIASHEMLFRCFTIPTVPKAELDAAVQFEARKYIPFKVTLLLWDYVTIPLPKTNRLNVVFGAIPKELLQKIQELLATAGVQAMVLEPISVSLARLVPPAKARDANEFVCLVDVTKDAAHLAIVKDRIPYLTRDVNLQGGEGGASEVREPGEAVSDARAQQLLSELSVSMDFFLREYPATTITQVLLCGDDALVGPWCDPLSQRLHCPVSLGRPLIHRRVSETLPLPFAAALGLLDAITEVGGAFNFLKPGLAKEPPQAAQGPAMQRALEAGFNAAWRMPHVKTFATGAMAGLALLWGLGMFQVSAQRRQLAQLVQARAPSSQPLALLSQEDLELMKQQISAQAAALRRVIEGHLGVAAKLDALARALPEGVWLTGVSFDNPLDDIGRAQAKLSIQGSCYLGEAGKELNAIQQFEDQLKRNAAFVRGFGSAQVDRIAAEAGPNQRYMYRTFQFNCQPSRKL